MTKKTVTFRCDCGYIETSDVIYLPFLGELVNDYIQFGKIYILARQHALEIHNQKLDFSLFSFVRSQRIQRKAKKEELKKFKELLQRNQEQNPEMIKFLNQIRKAAEQKKRYEEWQNIKKTG